MDLERLLDALSARREPPYRAAHAWSWAARGGAGYAEMTNLPAG